MNNFKNVLMFLSGLLVAACDLNSVTASMEGQYYYGGQGIYKIDLSSGKSQLIYDLPEKLASNVSKVTDSKLLLSIENLNSLSSSSEIVTFDLKSSEIKEVVSGSMPTYISSHKKIFFYRGKKLYVYDMKNPERSINFITEVSAPILTPVIQVSEDEIVFEDKKEEYGVWKYNIISSEKTLIPELSDCSLNNSFFRIKTNQLFCVERVKDDSHGGGKYLIDLDRYIRTELSLGYEAGWWPLSYFENQDRLLFQKRGSTLLGLRETHSLWMYNFKDGSRSKLADDTMIVK